MLAAAHKGFSERTPEAAPAVTAIAACFKNSLRGWIIVSIPKLVPAPVDCDRCNQRFVPSQPISDVDDGSTTVPFVGRETRIFETPSNVAVHPCYKEVLAMMSNRL